MNERHIVVLDAGTSSLRCVVFDRRGRTVASTSSPWSYRTVPDASPFAREFDAESVWRSVCRLVRGALANSGSGPLEVAAVTATGQRQAVVFLDAAGDAVYAGPNLDLRAVFEGGAIDDEMGDAVYATTGHIPSFLLAPAKLRWFQDHRPEAYARIAAVLTLPDWLLSRLSDVMLSEPSLAGEAGLLDIGSREWSSDLMEELGLVGNGHVPLVDAGTVAGSVRSGVAAEVGIAAGTPVVISGADTQCGLLGMGVIREGQAGVVAGWSVSLQAVAGVPRLAAAKQTWAGCFLTPGAWVLESSAGDAGNSYRWLADTVWGGGPQAFAEMDAQASAAPPGADGTLAVLGPTRMDMGATGLRQGGILFPVPMTMTEIHRGHLARAAMEGVAFAVRTNLRQAEEVSRHAIEEIAVGGGMTLSSTWTRVLVDVLGRQVKVSPAPNVSAAGAFLCASVGIGELASLREAADAAGASLRAIDPEPLAAAEYDGHYQRWLDITHGLQKVGP